MKKVFAVMRETRNEEGIDIDLLSLYSSYNDAAQRILKDAQVAAHCDVFNHALVVEFNDLEFSFGEEFIKKLKDRDQLDGWHSHYVSLFDAVEECISANMWREWIEEHKIQ